jgi:uncharacterized protein YegP (UPF0339 family)
MSKGEDMGKFVCIKTEAGFHFVLKAGNDEIIGTSEVFTTEAACENGICSVVANAVVAPIEDQTVEGFKTEKNPKFVLSTDKGGKFRFNLTATNGEPILASQAYASMKSAQAGIASVKVNAAGGYITKQ